MLDMVEEVSGQLREMGLVSDAQGVGYVYPPLPAELGKANPGIGCLQRRNPALESSSDVGKWYDIELRSILLLGTLSQLQFGTAATVTGRLRIVARFRLPVPSGVH